MFKWAILFLFLFLLLGCDKVVKTQVINSWEHEGTASCTYSGFCVACGPMIGFDGKFGMKCGFGYSINGCHGNQPARIRTLVEEYTHESGKVSQWTNHTVLQRWGTCS